MKNVNISRDYYYREKGRLEGTLAANEMGIGNLNVINYFFLECQNCNRLSCRRRESVIQLIDKKEERTLLKGGYASIRLCLRGVMAIRPA